MKINVTCWTSKWIMELVKNHILIVPFHDLLCNTTLDPILDHFWFTSQKFHPFKCCLLQIAIRNKSVSLGSSNFQHLQLYFSHFKNLQQPWFQRLSSHHLFSWTYSLPLANLIVLEMTFPHMLMCRVAPCQPSWPTGVSVHAQQRILSSYGDILQVVPGDQVSGNILLPI